MIKLGMTLMEWNDIKASPDKIQGTNTTVVHSVVSDSWRPNGLQHARLPCPSLSPRACSNSCPLSWLCHSIISFSVVPFSSCPQSFPASGCFPMSQLFTSGGQSIGASASVLPMNIQDWFPLGWTGLISLQSKGLKSLLQHHSSKASILQCSAFFMIQVSHPYMTTGKTIAFTRQTFVSKVVSLLFNMLSRLVIAFLPKSKCLLISWLQSPSAVIFEAKKTKLATVSPSICHEVIGPDAMIFAFWTLSFKPSFSLYFFTFIKRLYCLKGGIICIFAVIDISPGNLDSSLCFIQPGILHDVLCIHRKWTHGKDIPYKWKFKKSWVAILISYKTDFKTKRKKGELHNDKGIHPTHWVGTINLMHMSFSKLQELVIDREAWYAAVHGVAKSWTWLSNGTELCI